MSLNTAERADHRADATSGASRVQMRRLIAFGIDTKVVQTLQDLTLGQLLAPSAERWLPLMAVSIVLGYRIGLEFLLSGGSFGKALCGLKVASLNGGPPSLRATFMRSAVFALVLGSDPIEVVTAIVGFNSPSAWSGIVLGGVSVYVTYCLWTTVRGRRTALPHDSWTHTRVARADQQAKPAVSDFPDSGFGSLKTLLACGVLAGVVVLACLDSGPLSNRLLGVGKHPPTIDEKIERGIAEKFNLRSSVSMGTGFYADTEIGSHKNLTLEIALPFGAWGDGLVPRVHEFVLENLHLPPEGHTRLEFETNAKMSGLMDLGYSIKQTFLWQESSKTWEPVDE